jgi:glycine cleavage system H protein
MNVPENLKYTEHDEWVRLEGDVATIGITDYAQNELGEIVFVELPEVGAALAAGDALGVVESVKAVADVYAPLAGEVTEVNDALPDDPSQINSSAFEDCWLIKIKVSDTAPLDGLMDAATYKNYRS